MTNKEKYKKAFDVLVSSEQISLEVNTMKNKRFRIKNVAAAVAICCILGGAGTGVYAAAKYFGIMDFANKTAVEVPEDAKQQIQKDIQTTQADNDTIFDCSVKEALCDSESITLVYEVSAKEADKYLFVPEDALPRDPMSNLGYTTDKTVGEYAAEHNLTIVNIGGGITNTEELGIVEESMDFSLVSDDVIDICVHSNIAEGKKTMNVDVVAIGRQADSEDVMRLETGFQLQDMSTTTLINYTCGSNTLENTFFKIEKAEVIQTDLGTYVDVYYTNENGQSEEDGLTFRIVSQDGNPLEEAGGSGMECVDETHYKQRCMLNKCEIGDSLYIEAFDCFEKNVYGITELNRES